MKIYEEERKYLNNLLEREKKADALSSADKKTYKSAIDELKKEIKNMKKQLWDFTYALNQLLIINKQINLSQEWSNDSGAFWKANPSISKLMDNAFYKVDEAFRQEDIILLDIALKHYKNTWEQAYKKYRNPAQQLNIMDQNGFTKIDDPNCPFKD